MKKRRRSRPGTGAEPPPQHAESEDQAEGSADAPSCADCEPSARESAAWDSAGWDSAACEEAAACCAGVAVMPPG